MKYLYILIFIFYFYSFAGWIIEVIFTCFQEKKLINRGFLIGPMCPIYGIGCVLILLLLNKYHGEPVTLFFMAIIICSILEYTTSYLMEKIFKNRWWDYTSFKYNINGRICLETMIPFGFLALIMYYGINPFLIKTFSAIPITILKYSVITMICITFLDIIFSFNVILNLKNISNSLRCDSTEVITKKVKEALMNKNILYRRLVKSFPNMKVFNKMSILKERLIQDKDKLKQEKEKVKQQKKKK